MASLSVPSNWQWIMWTYGMCWIVFACWQIDVEEMRHGHVGCVCVILLFNCGNGWVVLSKWWNPAIITIKDINVLKKTLFLHFTTCWHDLEMAYDGTDMSGYVLSLVKVGCIGAACNFPIFPLGLPALKLIRKQQLLSNSELKWLLWNAVAMESSCKVQRQRR